MPEVLVDKKTKWECQRCGDCCRGVIVDKSQDLTEIKDGATVCKHLEENRCRIYNERPFICRIYPFVADFDKMIVGGVLRPQDAFLLENLKIHTECPGFGKGKRVYGNSNLKKKFSKLGCDLAVRIKEIKDPMKII